MKEQNFQEEHLHQNPNPNPNQDPNQSQGLGLNQIERFINTQVVSRGLDERTAKAYKLDLELFFRWLEMDREGNKEDGRKKVISAPPQYLEGKMEEYLQYLSREKERRFSTVCR